MILTVELDNATIIKRHPEIEQERAIAIRDILQHGQISLPHHSTLKPPYHIRIGLRGRRLIIHIQNEDKSHQCELAFSLSPYKKLIKDYFLICESYSQTYNSGDKTKLESIDMARRGLHNEGASILKDRLEKDIQTDIETARCLFTLIAILHIGAKQIW